MMAIFPAVFVEKLPEFLQKDAKRTAGALLGQNREGIVFWRLHPELPKFLVVFRRREERDVFFRSNQLQQVGLGANSSNRNAIRLADFWNVKLSTQLVCL